jgi:hypothetical protein
MIDELVKVRGAVAVAITTGGRAQRVLLAIGGLLIAVGAVHLVVQAVDPRPWLGPLAWRKPAAFGSAFGSLLIAVLWVSSYLRVTPRQRAVLLGVFAADCVLEVAGITVQAWRNVPSHLDTATPFDTAVAMVLAFGGVALFVVLGPLAGTALRGRFRDGVPASMRSALRSGFALLMVGLLSGAAMIARGEVLLRSASTQYAYDHLGFLKWVHAEGLNGVWLLPLLAWILGRLPALDEARRTRWVRAAAAGYTAVVAGTAAVNLLLM